MRIRRSSNKDKQPDLLGQSDAKPDPGPAIQSGPIEVVRNDQVSEPANLADGLETDTPHTSQHVTPPRIVHAMESDFLDSTSPSRDADHVSADPAAAEAVAAGAQLIDMYASGGKGAKAGDNDDKQGGAAGERSASQVEGQTDAEGVVVSDEEQTGTDGEAIRPTGMVFFETVTSGNTPPQGIVRSAFPGDASPRNCSQEGPFGQSGGRDDASDASPDAARHENPQVSGGQSDSLEPPDEHADPELPAADSPRSAEESASHAALQAFYSYAQAPEESPEDEYAAEHSGAAPLIIASAPLKSRSVFYSLFNLACWCLLGAFVLFVTATVVYGRHAWKRLYSPQPVEKRTVTLVVQQGDSLNTISQKLRKEGLLGSYYGLDDRFLMRYLGHVNENANKIKPGAYRFDSTLSLNDIYARLIKGSQDFKITVPEGRTAREIATEAKRRYDGFDSQRFEALLTDQQLIASLKIDAPSLEGYLYPSTYFFGPGMKEEELVRQMVTTFQKRADEALKTIPQQDKLTFHQHVIMASLIEREARVDEDRPLIASVIFNRLEKDMPLQIDATVNYALNDWRRLSYEDLKMDSPYNTYKNKGLPPGPIANPRIESLVATFASPKTDYLYYVYQGNGRHAFSATYEEFLKNKRLYLKEQTAVESPAETTMTGAQNVQEAGKDAEKNDASRSAAGGSRRARRQ